MSPALVSARHLTDSFSELLAYVMGFRQNAAQQQPGYDDVRSRILTLLKQSESCLAQGLCTAEDYDLARFAVCAWVDESIMSSAWIAKNRWRPEMLQRLFYQVTDAGEKFFQRLKQLEADQQGVREVYTLCLALGFKGRYCADDDTITLDQLKERNLKWLFNSVNDVPSFALLEKNTLFPEAYPSGSIATSIRVNRWPWVIIGTIPIGGLLALLFTYYVALRHLGEVVRKVFP